MTNGEVIPFKVYLINPNGGEPEIRRFAVEGSVAYSFSLFEDKLKGVFPGLSDKVFRICWKDEEGDEVVVSSDVELIIALTSMKTDVKKFFVKFSSSAKDSTSAKFGPTERQNSVLHADIFCDGCENNVLGFRYKCVMCHDYDLCEGCEKEGVHADHVMLRIPHPNMLDRHSLKKLIHFMAPFAPRDRHRDRKHAFEGGHPDDSYPEARKKHKKCDRRESGPETGDESEEGHHRRHSHHGHKKWKKGKCPYSQFMGNFSSFFYPEFFPMKNEQGCGETPRQEASEESVHAKYLRSVGMTLQKFLDPLGVEVDFEVRTNGEKKNDEKKKETTGEENTSTAPSAPPSQKEVRFADSQETSQKVEEIAKLLAKQTMGEGSNTRGSTSSSSSSSKSGDNDGWVEFEELEKDTEEQRPSGSTGAIPKTPQPKDNTSNGENKQPEQAIATEVQNLYPNLNAEELPLDPGVRISLQKMLAMGFTNEGNWLTKLLEAKKGNINQALEALEAHRKM